MAECEYCGANEVSLYAWLGDVWCGSCLLLTHRMNPVLAPLSGSLEDAAGSRPVTPVNDQPYVWRTPDGRVDCGELDVYEALAETAGSV